MCGRFSQYSPVADLVAHFGVDESMVTEADRRPRYNVAPTQQVLVVAASAEGSSRRLGMMRWGLVPHWAKDPSIGNRMINARTDKVATSNAYRPAFARRRCLVPADGFYEWAKPDTVAADRAGARADRRNKVPFHIHSFDGTPLALAGLWETWHDADGAALRSFTILTTDARGEMARIHHRMPVLLDAADWSTWLAPEPLDEADRTRLLSSAGVDTLTLDEVSTLVNRPSNDTPEVIAAV